MTNVNDPFCSLIRPFVEIILCFLKKLELNITLGSRKTGKKEYRVMIKKNENIYKLKTNMLKKWMERKEKLLVNWSFDDRMLRFQKLE